MIGRDNKREKKMHTAGKINRAKKRNKTIERENQR